MYMYYFWFSSVAPNSLRPLGLQHARLPCPSPTPRVYSDSCPSSLWCHPTISSSVISFSCLQSFPASGSFLRGQFFPSGDGKYWSFSISPSVSIQDWFPLGWTGWISLQSKGLSRVFTNTTVQKHQFFGIQLSLKVQPSHPYTTSGKTIALTRWTFVGKVMSLLFNMLSRLVITFLPRSKCLIFTAAVIICNDFGAQKIKYLSVSIVSLSICHEVIRPDTMIFIFWMLSLKLTFSLSSVTFIKRLFSSLLSAIRLVSSAYLRLLIFLSAILIPTCASSSPTFWLMYSAYKLNKLGDKYTALTSSFSNL